MSKDTFGDKPITQPLVMHTHTHTQTLKVQLALFRMKYSFQSSAEIVAVFQGMTPEVCGLFDQVETVTRLLLVVPVSSAESERSFSSLRRLKTWLRSTMTQTRLNSVAVYSVVVCSVQCT